MTHVHLWGEKKVLGRPVLLNCEVEVWLVINFCSLINTVYLAICSSFHQPSHPFMHMWLAKELCGCDVKVTRLWKCHYCVRITISGKWPRQPCIVENKQYGQVKPVIKIYRIHGVHLK